MNAARRFILRGMVVWSCCSLAVVGCFSRDPGREPVRGEKIGGRGVVAFDRSVPGCLSCHATVALSWAYPSAHSALFDCTACHQWVSPEVGLGHAESPRCERCHAQGSHPAGTSCSVCHDPHGSPNLLLIRIAVTTPQGDRKPIRLRRLEGASPDGLVRAGVPGQVAGSGLCEICHSRTRHYDRDGTALSHERGWCGRCHPHALGFAAARDAG